MSSVFEVLHLENSISGLFYKTSMILIYDRNDSNQYYKTMNTIVFTILAKSKAEASLS